MEIFSYDIRIYFYVKLTTNWPCHDSKFAGDVQYSFRMGLAAGKEKKRSVRRRVSSGNVVPAVGKCEGAKPRRMEYLAITKFKKFIRLPKFSLIYFMFVSALTLCFRRGFAPSGFPTRGTNSPMSPLFNRSSRRSRNPRRYSLGKLYTPSPASILYY